MISKTEQLTAIDFYWGFRCSLQCSFLFGLPEPFFCFRDHTSFVGSLEYCHDGHAFKKLVPDPALLEIERG